MKVYLDNAATTKPDTSVVKAMQECLLRNYGNPSSAHYCGIEAETEINAVRKLIAKKINAMPNEIIFTSGGTESNNFCIKGIAKASGKRHIVTSEIEHASVLGTCESLEKEGYDVTYVKVNKDGFINPKDIEKAVTSKTSLVTVMHANNEVGSIQPMENIGKICKRKNVALHIDAVQSFMKAPIDVRKMNISALSISAHKIHGPKGIGAAYIKQDVPITPLIHGGRQEHMKRGGTQNVPGIIGLGKAIESWEDINFKLRDYMIKRILKEVPDARLNSPKEKSLANIMNISFNGIEGESILLHLSSLGVAVSTGSACHERQIKISHVLNAMGIPKERAKSAIRISLSKLTTKKEIDYSIDKLKTVIESLRRVEQ